MENEYLRTGRTLIEHLVEIDELLWMKCLDNFELTIYISGKEMEKYSESFNPKIPWKPGEKIVFVPGGSHNNGKIVLQVLP